MAYGTNLCFKSTGSTTVTLNKIGSPNETTIKYSTDGTNWNTVNGAISLSDGAHVAFSGNAKFSKNIQNRYSFSTAGTGTLAISGYLSSLISSATIEDDYEFNSLFSGCTNITDASGLVLPSNTTEWCYANMFIDCTNLINTPTLPASSLNKWCYSSMFANCQNLTKAPTLSAIDLASSCYYCMFYGCKNLTDAPALPASTLTDWCYNSMFYNDSKLSSMNVGLTAWTPSSATSNWVNGIAQSGIFNKPNALTAIYDVSHIPNDWSLSTQPEPTPQTDYSQMPLTFKSHGTTYLNLRSRGRTSTVDNVPKQNFYISRNGGAWQLYCAKTGDRTYTNMVYASNGYNAPILTLTDGQTVAFSGTLNNFSYNSQNDSSEWQFNNYTTQNGTSKSNWSSSNYLQVYGNVKSLHNWETLATNQCYRSMFRDSTMISSCFNVVFENDSNLNRANGYASVFRDSRVVLNPKMVTFSDTSYSNLLDYTWNGASQMKYVGYSRGNWNNWGGGARSIISNGGVLCKTPDTPLPNLMELTDYDYFSWDDVFSETNFRVINWHSSDDTYWVVNSSNQETGQQVTLNDDGTITYL